VLSLNTDQSKNGLFKGIVYTCAAAGGIAGYALAPAAGAGLVAAYVAGGVAVGGLGGPLALTTAALCGYGVYRIGQTLAKTAREEGPVIPLAVAIVGYSSLRAMTVEPIRSIASLFKKSAQKQKNSSDKNPTSTPKPKDITP
jgi:hypothetical protein